MATYNQLMSEIKPYATDAVNPEIIDCIKRAVIDFCRRSRIWKETINVKIKENKYLYTFNENGARVEQVLSGVIKTSKIEEPMNLKPDSLLSTISSRRFLRGYNYSQPSSGNKVRIYPIPDSSHLSPNVDFYCVLAPTRQSNSYPDFILEEWYEALITGSVYNLLRIPNKPWTDYNLSIHHNKQFLSFITEAKQESVTDNWSEVRARPRPWI